MEASHPSPSPELRLGLQRRAFPGRGAGNPRMAGSRLASDPAPTSAFSAGTFLPAASRHCLWKPTEDPPHSEWDVLTGVVLWSSLIGSQFSILAPGGKASSRGWGSWEPQVVYLLGRLRFPGTSSASCIPLGPPLALVCIFFALPFLFAPVSRLLSQCLLAELQRIIVVSTFVAFGNVT